MAACKTVSPGGILPRIVDQESRKTQRGFLSWVPGFTQWSKDRGEDEEETRHRLDAAPLLAPAAPVQAAVAERTPVKRPQRQQTLASEAYGATQLSATVPSNDEPDHTVVDPHTPIYGQYSDYQKRLRSFQSWSIRTVSKYSLAEGGYFWRNGRPTCFHCGHNSHAWRHGEKVATVHYNESPECLYAQKMKYFQQMRSLEERRKTLESWSHPVITGDQIARAGLFLRPDGATQCAYCKGVITVWNDEFPLNKHGSLFPTCPFILQLPSYAIGVDECGPFSGSSQGRSDPPSPGEVVHRPAKHPNMISPDSRMVTFEGWTGLISKEDLVEAGFFSLSIQDFTKCFHCGGSLCSLKPGDVAWEEHARWYPKCEYVRVNKGDEYIQEVLKRHTDLMESIGACGGAEEVEEGVLPNVLEQELQSLCAGNDFKFFLQKGVPEKVLKMTLKKFMLDKRRGFESRDEFSHVLSSALSFGRVGPEEKSKDIRPPAPPVVNDSMLCKICLQREVGIVFVPCGHLATCPQCASTLENCPICRKTIVSLVRTYLV